MRFLQIAMIVALLGVAASARAQSDRLGSGAPTVDYHAGWTFTPTVGVSETYDDNITLFGLNTADQLNNDYVTLFFPSADLHYEGKHTQFGVGYGGSFLGYRTYDGLNRWDQSGTFELRRQESAHLKWFMHGSGATRPETDLIDFGGIPYRHTGAQTIDGRAGAEYALNARDSLVFAAAYQDMQFERSDLAPNFLRGGNMLENDAMWRHQTSERLAFGADYSFRRAMVVGDTEHFNLHSIEAAADYDVSPSWTVNAAAGVVYMPSTAISGPQTGPAWRLAISRHRENMTVHGGYLTSYIPAFGFGGVIRNQELRGGLRMQLFGSRRFYTDNTIEYRIDDPLIATDLQLPLHSLREYSVFGWEPDRWVRLEVFYARVDQTSLRPGGQLYRDRIGFQIVTSKPMRIQ